MERQKKYCIGFYKNGRKCKYFAKKGHYCKIHYKSNLSVSNNIDYTLLNNYNKLDKEYKTIKQEYLHLIDEHAKLLEEHQVLLEKQSELLEENKNLTSSNQNNALLRNINSILQNAQLESNDNKTIDQIFMWIQYEEHVDDKSKTNDLINQVSDDHSWFHEANSHLQNLQPNENCAICKEVMHEDMEMLNCKHTFHYKCIHKWLLESKHKDCPICRKKPDKCYHY